MNSNLSHTEEPLLRIEHLTKHFVSRSGSILRKNHVKAVEDVSFSIYKGETYGLVGESGSGKSTTGRTLLRLAGPTSGKAYFEDRDIFSLPSKALKALRKDMQMIFQDPHSSLDPKNESVTALLSQ